jgi:hypothetical protein
MRISVGGRYAAAFCLVSGLSLAACTDSANKGASTQASSAAAPAQSPTIQGTWKLSEPTSSFKPVSGEVPFTEDGRAAYESNKANYDKGNFAEYDYAQSRCASPGVPRLALTPDPFRIWLRPSYVLFQYQWNRLTRQAELPGIIPQSRTSGEISGPGDVGIAPGINPFGTMKGSAKANWDGDTLVVTTDALSGATLIDNLVPHGYKSKITERLRLTDKDTLEDRITIEDAEYFTKPWETVVTYKRQPDDPFKEDVCLDRLASGQLPLPK